MFTQENRLQITTLLALTLVSQVALAADATTPPDGSTQTDASKVETSTPEKKNTTSGSNGQTADDLLANNELRALSGSTSLLSIASQFNYNGGTISSPLSQDRPNISDASGTTIKSDLDGSISAKYNLNNQNSVMAGFGIRWIAPMSTGALQNYSGTTFDAMNPYVQYQYIYKWFGIQSVLQASVMQWTQADQTAYGYAQQFQVDQENMFEIGKTGLSVGASTWVQFQTFNKSGAYGSPNDPDTYIPDLHLAQSQWAFAIAPVVEYQLTEKINLRTLVNLAMFEHYIAREYPQFFTHDTIYQSVGVGYSVTRDIFLYPNVQFLPGQLAANMTNVGLAATVNVF